MSIIQQTLPDGQNLYRWGIPSVIYPERAPKMVGPSVIWVDDSPFGIPGVDCRPLTFGNLSVFTDITVPQTFDRVRQIRGWDCLDQAPKNAQTVNCSLIYPALAQKGDDQLFVPQIFEDRWLILRYAQQLYVLNSYTGELLLMADVLDLPTGKVHITRISYSAELQQGLIISEMDFLIKSHVLDRWCPHQISPDIGLEPSQIAHHAWLRYGRRGWFATNIDTTLLDIDLKSWPDDDK